MATFPYDDFRALATELIGPVFGERTVTLRRPNDTPADPSKPWRGPDHSDPTEITGVSAVFVGISQNDRAGLDQVLQGDQMALIAAESLSEEIDADWQIIDEGTAWEIVAVASKIKPGNDMIFYKFQVRA